MKTIAVANMKGGVGKTTLAVHLATYLNRHHHRVGLIDADLQGNASSWIMEDIDSGALADVVFGRTKAIDAFYTIEDEGSPFGRISILPGNYTTGNAYVYLSAIQAPVSTIHDALKGLEVALDYLIIDMPPSQAFGFRHMLYACDYVLVPTQLERFPAEGITFMSTLLTSMARDQGYAPKLLGIVPNKVELRTNTHRFQVEKLAELFGPLVWPAIPKTIKVADAIDYGATVYNLPGTSDIITAFDSIGRRVVENATDTQRRTRGRA